MMPILSGTTRSAWPRSNHLRTAGHRTAREAIRGTTGESAHCAGLPPGSATLARIPGIKTSIPGQLLQQSVHAARTDHPGTFGVGRRDIRTGYRHYRHHSLFQNGPVGATKVTWQHALLNRRALLRRFAGAKQRIRRLLQLRNPPTPRAERVQSGIVYEIGETGTDYPRFGAAKAGRPDTPASAGPVTEDIRRSARVA